MGFLQEDDECLTLYRKMMQHAHLACSEAFDVQLENAGPLELVDGAPKMRIAPS